MAGLILIDKPKNITSFGAVAKIRKLTGEKRVGHTGTLDPMATGVLPVLIGRATALSPYLLESDKIYKATIKFGIKTDTYDITGNILETVSKDMLSNLSEADINAALKHFTGKQLQQPPMFSALKRNGVPLYKLARQGKSVKIEKREIEIYYIKLLNLNLIDYECEIEVKVSKGTYIRSLVCDIGDFLGCKATLKDLQRISVSGFSLKECVSLDDLNEENVQDYIMSAEKAVSYMPNVFVTEKQAVRFSNGGALSLDRIKIGDIKASGHFIVKHNDIFLGIGEADEISEELKVKCVIESFKKEENQKP